MLIRFGQWLRPSWRAHRKWNHAAVIVEVGGPEIMVVQMGAHGELVPISEVAPGGHYRINKAPPGICRKRVVKFAREQIGVDYSVAAIFSIALNLVTPKWVAFDFRRGPSALICSALVARSWEHGGWSCPSDPFQITPAELAMYTEGDLGG